MSHVNAEIGEHALELAVANRELQVPIKRPQNDLRCERPLLIRFFLPPNPMGPLKALVIIAHAACRSKLQQNHTF